MKYDINTYTVNKAIIQESSFGFEDYSKKMILSITDTKDKGVVKALIELGWTPPNKNKPRTNRWHFFYKGTKNMVAMLYSKFRGYCLILIWWPGRLYRQYKWNQQMKELAERIDQRDAKKNSERS